MMDFFVKPAAVVVCNQPIQAVYPALGNDGYARAARSQAARRAKAQAQAQAQAQASDMDTTGHGKTPALNTVGC